MITDLIADIGTDEKTAAMELSLLNTNKQLGREHVLMVSSKIQAAELQEVIMSERIRKHMIDLSIVGFKGEYDDRESRFVGIGISGYQIAKRLSEKCFDILDPVLSKSVLDIIHETGESSKLLNQSLSNLHRNTLLIIAGSISDPNLHSLRNIALSKNPMFLWTILDAPKNAIEFASSIQPQISESITIIPQGADSIDQSIVLVQTLIHYLQEAGLIGIEFKDVSDLFAGRLTKIMNVITNNQSYIEDIKRFIIQNKTHLLYARSTSLILFAGPSLTNSTLDHITALFFYDIQHRESNELYGVYIEEEFGSKLHIAIIVDEL